jgi:hypothetical protein
MIYILLAERVYRYVEIIDVVYVIVGRCAVVYIVMTVDVGTVVDVIYYRFGSLLTGFLMTRQR